MQIKTFRAKTMQQALDLVRRELGPKATVYHTREVNGSVMKRLLLGRQYEIAAARPAAASDEPAPEPTAPEARPEGPRDASPDVALDLSAGYRDRYRQDLRDNSDDSLAELQALVEELRGAQVDVSQAELPVTLFDLFTDLIDADVDEQLARDLVDRLRNDDAVDLSSPLSARARLVQLIESEFEVSGPLARRGERANVVALVGPTGVGKTTTIAKLAANFRLRERQRVGLITVDTYRIAAVDQLRTYADIIDLPMEVVSTPREMRDAAARMRDLDLVLIDTAGRSPRDDVKIQELRATLAEAEPNEVHLVLSAVASARSNAAVAEKFALAGVTSAIVTKLDEAVGLGPLLSLARSSQLPLSYLTDGQNVPDDIRLAEKTDLARATLGIAEQATADG